MPRWGWNEADKVDPWEVKTDSAKRNSELVTTPTAVFRPLQLAGSLCQQFLGWCSVQEHFVNRFWPAEMCRRPLSTVFGLMQRAAGVCRQFLTCCNVQRPAVISSQLPSSLKQLPMAGHGAIIGWLRWMLYHPNFLGETQSITLNEKV